MQDRLAEACRSTHRRINMQRVEITGEPIEQRLLRPRRQIDYDVRHTIRKFHVFDARLINTTKSTVTAQQMGLMHRRQ